MDFDAACERYRLLDVPGFMHPPEMAWLYAMAVGMDGGATAVEIGTLHGRSACAILAGLSISGGRLICVDSFTGESSELPPSRDAVREVAGLRSTIGERGLPMPTIMTGMSQSRRIVAQVPDGSVDWLFIDADHSCEGTAREIRLWRPKLSPRGILSGHDIGHAGVLSAVLACCGEWDEPAGSIWVER